MSSRVVTLSMANDYPFSIARDYNEPRTTIQVRQSILFNHTPRPILKEKIRYLKILQNCHIVQLLSTSEQQDRINLIFEYIHKKLDTQIFSLDVDTIQWYKGQMLALVDKLASNCIVSDICFENVGVGRNGELKYFLGVDFGIQKGVIKQELSQKYKSKVQRLFGDGGRFKRAHSKQQKMEFLQTMDTTKINSSNEHFLSSWQPGSQNTPMVPTLSMKKSSTLMQNYKTSPSMSQQTPSPKNYQKQQHSQLKILKIQDISSRINKLKDYVKNITGKTPKSKAQMAHLTVKIDQNNIHNRILQENKLYISPNYTKLEKKIAEWRQSKFYRAYGQQAVLFKNDKQGYQLRSSQKITSIQPEKKAIPSKAPIYSPKNQIQRSRSPHHFKNIPTNLFKKTKTMDSEQNKHKSKESLNSQRSKVSQGFQLPYQKQYQKLAQTDKYCEQFMSFLEQDTPVERPAQRSSPLTKILGNMGEQQQDRVQKKQSAQIQSKVKKAIRNSLKLINNIKYRESHS